MRPHIYFVGDVMSRSRRFFTDLAVLTLSSTAMRAVSVLFSSWLKNEIGAMGVGLYQLIMSVYVFGVTFASSGIRLACTRLTVEEGARSREVMKKCLAYALFFGFAASVALFCVSDVAAAKLLGDKRTAKSLKVLAFGLPPLAASSAFSGFLSAKRKASRSAAVQTAEQLVKIAVSVLLLKKFLPRGLDYACVALVSGSLCSEIVSSALYCLIYLRTVKGTAMTKSRGLLKRLLSIALPDAVSSYLRSALNTATQLLVPSGLKKNGGSAQDALSQYGMIGGMALNVIFFPSALLDAANRLIIPELAEDRARGREMNVELIVNRALRFSVLFSGFVCSCLWAWGPKIGTALYSSARTGKYIFLLAPFGGLCYVDSAVDGMLKGLGQQNASMRINVADSAVTLLLTLVLIPLWGVAGYIVILYATEVMNLVLSVLRLKKVTRLRLGPSAIASPVFCAAGSAALFSRLSLHPALCIPCAGAFFVLSSAAFGAVKPEDARWLKKVFSKDRGPEK